MNKVSDNVDNEPLLEKPKEEKDTEASEADEDSKSEVEFEEGKKKDPIYFRSVSLGTDFYSLTWHSLKKSAFVGKKVRGVDICLLPQDYFWLYINFILFIGLLLISVFLILQEALIDDVYVEGDWMMDVLRILLVIFTQIHLGAEIELAYAKFLYPITNHHEFYHPSMAIFIGFSHCLVCVVIMIGLIVFVCMADEFADPVINFAGICVLSELDDWLGDTIVNVFKLDSDDDIVKELEEEKDEEKKTDLEKKLKKSRRKYTLKHLNERMNLFNKMALLADDDSLVKFDEGIYERAPFYIVWFEKLVSVIPWWLILPLSTIPISHYLPYFTKELRAKLGYNY